MKQITTYKPLLFYFLKFGGAFCLFYFGTLAVIGLSTPENQYSKFVADYLNFINPLRASLLYGAKGFLSLTGTSTFFSDTYTLKMQSGEGVRMVYSCIGYGVMSFWTAFIVANNGSWQKKMKWSIGGLIALWSINVLRIGLLLLATNKHWPVPFGWDHHTWFNIFAYATIFGMIYFYDRSFKKNVSKEYKTKNVITDT